MLTTLDPELKSRLTRLHNKLDKFRAHYVEFTDLDNWFHNQFRTTVHDLLGSPPETLTEYKFVLHPAGTDAVSEFEYGVQYNSHHLQSVDQLASLFPGVRIELVSNIPSEYERGISQSIHFYFKVDEFSALKYYALFIATTQWKENTATSFRWQTPSARLWLEGVLQSFKPGMTAELFHFAIDAGLFATETAFSSWLSTNTTDQDQTLPDTVLTGYGA